MDEATQTIEKLDQLIARRSILEHPFYQAWRQGKLSWERLTILRPDVLSTRGGIPGVRKQQ